MLHQPSSNLCHLLSDWIKMEDLLELVDSHQQWLRYQRYNKFCPVTAWIVLKSHPYGTMVHRLIDDHMGMLFLYGKWSLKCLLSTINFVPQFLVGWSTRKICFCEVDSILFVKILCSSKNIAHCCTHDLGAKILQCSNAGNSLSLVNMECFTMAMSTEISNHVVKICFAYYCRLYSWETWRQHANESRDLGTAGFRISPTLSPLLIRWRTSYEPSEKTGLL